jgi:hypothetical protein
MGRRGLVPAALGLALAGVVSMGAAQPCVPRVRALRDVIVTAGGQEVVELSWKLDSGCPLQRTLHSATPPVLTADAALLFTDARGAPIGEAIVALGPHLAPLGAVPLTALPPCARLRTGPSHMRFAVRLVARDGSFNGSWSAAASWYVAAAPVRARDVATAPVTDWGGAAWIGTSASAPSGPAQMSASLLRADFAVRGGAAVQSATLQVIGLGQFHAWVNGTPAATTASSASPVDLRGYENSPPWTDWADRLLYSVFDVTGLLVAGQPATLALQLGNGMYNVPQPPDGRYTKWTGPPQPRMALAALFIGFEDGSNQTVATAPGTAWMATDGGAVVFTHQYAGEDRNITLETPGWQLPGFNPAAYPLVAWSPAVACTPPTGVLLPVMHETPQVRAHGRRTRGGAGGGRCCSSLAVRQAWRTAGTIRVDSPVAACRLTLPPPPNPPPRTAGDGNAARRVHRAVGHARPRADGRGA